MLRLDDDWIWDSWPFDVDGRHHLFFLKAPRALGDPDLRHVNVTIGHAVSDDWRAWELLPDALAPADGPAWDDYTTWTGSVVRGPDLYHLFYTGTSRVDGIAVQRIGRADSDDLVHWTRYGSSPLVAADPRWYESVDGGTGPRQDWRDPWVYREGEDGPWHMLVTAKVPGEGRGRGVVAHATSDDLDTWEVKPPLTEPGPFDHLEVVQTVALDGSHHLVASCGDGELNPEHHGHTATGGVYLIPGEGPVGPWVASRARRVAHRSLYAARLIDDHGTPALLGFRDIEDDGFIGDIPDPVPVVLEDDTSAGRHSLETASFEVNLG